MQMAMCRYPSEAKIVEMTLTLAVSSAYWPCFVLVDAVLPGWHSNCGVIVRFIVQLDRDEVNWDTTLHQPHKPDMGQDQVENWNRLRFH